VRSLFQTDSMAIARDWQPGRRSGGASFIDDPSW
jgi:hypothetical protein